MYRLKIDFYTPSSHFLTEYKHHKGTVPVLILSLDHPKGDLPKSHRASATAASCLRISETSRWGGLETWALRQCDKAIQGLGSRWEATRTWELRSYCKYTCYMYVYVHYMYTIYQGTPEYPRFGHLCGTAKSGALAPLPCERRMPASTSCRHRP